jgi:hypothetical protein
MILLVRGLLNANDELILEASDWRFTDPIIFGSAESMLLGSWRLAGADS